MAIVGKADILVNAITTNFKRQVQDAFDDVGSVAGRAGRQVGSSFSGSASQGLSAAEQQAMAVYEGINRLIEKSYYLQGAVVAAAGAIGVLVSGLFALGSQVAAATPALVVLPSIFSAIGQAAITAKLAFGGLGQAIGKAFKQQSGAGGIDKMPGLLQAVDSAQERHRNAVNRTEKAEKRLTEARKEALERIEELKFASEGAAISEKRASIELQKARESLARAQDLPPNSRARKEAELAFQEADLNYRRAIDKNSDLKKEVAEVTDNGKRSAEEEVEFSKEVVAAKEAVTEAIHDEKRAKDANVLAEKKLSDAKKGIGDGGGGGGDPFAGLNESQKKFAQFIVDLKPKIDELKESAGKELFPRLEIAIQNLVDNLFPSLNKILEDTGKALGNAAIDFSKIVTEADNLKNLNTVAGTNKDTIGKLGTVAGNLYSVFLSLLSAADPLVRRFTDWVVTLTNGWKASVEAKNKTGELTRMFNNAGDIAAQLGRILGNIGSALLDMGKAASGPGSGGQMIFDFLEKATEKFEIFAETGLKNGSLEEYFRVVAESFNKVLHILGVLSGAILKTADDEGTSSLFTSLSNAAEILATALGHLSEGGAGGAFGKFIEQIAKFMAATSEAGSLKIYFGVMTTALSLLNKLLTNPIASKLLMLAAAAHGGRTAFRRLGQSMTTFSQYITGDKLSLKAFAGGVKNMAGNFKAARGMNLGYFQSLKMTIGYTKIGTAVTKAWSGVTKAFTVVQKALNKAFMNNPALVWVIAIVALIAVIVVMYKKFKWFRDFVQVVWDGIKAVFSATWDAIVAAISFGWGYIKGVFEGFGMVFGLAWGGIKLLFESIWGIIKDGIAGGWGIIKGIFEAFGTVFGAVWDGIKLYYSTVWAIITGGIAIGWAAIKLIFEAFKTVFSLAWDGIKLAFNLAWDIIKKAVSFGWNNVIKPVFDAFGTVFGKVWDGIKTAFSTAWDFITGAISKAKDIFGGLGDAIKGAFKTAFNFVADMWNKTIGKIGFKAPKWLGGWEFSVPDITPLAEGGVVYPSPGGTLARIGEAGRAERVEPLDSDGLSRRDRAIITMLSGGKTGGINITVNPSPGMDEVELASLVSRQLALQLRRGAA